MATSMALYSSSPPAHSVSDSMDSSCLSSFSAHMIKSRSHNDLCSAREDSWCGAVAIPASTSGKLRECSPVSVFHGPSSHGSGFSSFRLSATARDVSGSSSGFSLLENNAGHSRRRNSLSSESRRPLCRYEGFEIRREQSCGSLSPKANSSCLAYEHSSEPSADSDFSEKLSSESGSVQPGSSSVKPSNLFVPLSRNLDTKEADPVMSDDGMHTCTSVSTTTAHGGLPFNNSSGLRALKKRVSLANEILRNAQLRHEIFNDPFVVKAFREAERAHIGQYRATGDPYIVHCVETALLLAAAGASKDVVAAGLLHDTLDDSLWDRTKLRVSFGDDVVNLVEGVSRLSELSQLARNNNTANNSLEADRLRTMFLAMVDVRVVLIKLADRLHNMRTLGSLPETKQQRIARETLELFAPLASRLGIWNWKAEMEDLCFKYLKPEEYHNLDNELTNRSREVYMMSAIKKLDGALREAGIPFHDLCGRTKNLYSIHSKMSRKGRSLDEICDVRGLRLIVTDVDSCFSALELIHMLWHWIPGKQKDYINHPKHNGYQSLHTAIMGEDGFPLEVQIRTMEMHHCAEFGVAAHWRYKEGHSRYSTYVSQRIEWARWVLTWHGEYMDSKLRLSPLELDLRPPCPFPFHTECCPHSLSQIEPPGHEKDPLLVIILEDEKMSVQELPFGSTASDLLRRITPKESLLSDFELTSWKEMRLLINHKIVNSLEQKLVMGDMVEFMPFIPAESLDKCREKIRRMYGDAASLKDSRENVSDVVSPTVASVLS